VLDELDLGGPGAGIRRRYRRAGKTPGSVRSPYQGGPFAKDRLWGKVSLMRIGPWHEPGPWPIKTGRLVGLPREVRREIECQSPLDVRQSVRAGLGLPPWGGLFWDGEDD
jgi:hypothetical protein